MVDRYEIIAEGEDANLKEAIYKYGDWVKYEYYVSLEIERNELQEKIAAAREGLS